MKSCKGLPSNILFIGPLYYSHFILIRPKKELYEKRNRNIEISNVLFCYAVVFCSYI